MICGTKKLQYQDIERDRAVDEQLLNDLHLKLVSHREITRQNCSQNFSFHLEGKYFGVQREFVVFTISGSFMAHIRDLFNEHIERLTKSENKKAYFG